LDLWRVLRTFGTIPAFSSVKVGQAFSQGSGLDWPTLQALPAFESANIVFLSRPEPAMIVRFSQLFVCVISKKKPLVSEGLFFDFDKKL